MSGDAFTDVERRFLLELERLDDPRIGEAARALHGCFDVVTTVQGSEDFAVERARAVVLVVSGVTLPLMPLARVAASKRASGRPKDLAQLPALEEALAVQEAEREGDPGGSQSQ